MHLRALRWLRWFLTGLFALLAATFVGLAVYGVMQFGLWWPKLLGVGGAWRQLLEVATMLPFLLLFTRLNWSRPMGWLAALFARLITPLDRRIAALESTD